MLYFTCRVANNYGVVDSDDGALEWVTKEELLEFAKLVRINGVADMKPVSCCLDSGKCNWSKGENIFTSAKSITSMNGVDFVITTEQGKKYKGKVVKTKTGFFMHFTCNVKVPISSRLATSIEVGDNSALGFLRENGAISLNV